MELVLRGLQWAFLLIYLDNVIITGKTFHDHLNNLGEVLSRCRQFGLKLKPTKCNLFKEEVLFLGHVVGKYGIHVNKGHNKLWLKMPYFLSKRVFFLLFLSLIISKTYKGEDRHI